MINRAIKMRKSVQLFRLSLLVGGIMVLCNAGSAHFSIPAAHADTVQTGCCYDAESSYCTSDATKDNCKSPKIFEPGKSNCKTLHPSCQSGPLYVRLNVPLPNFSGGTVDSSLFGRYVSAFYVYFAGVAGILAVVMIMYGGFHYITSLGNPQRMNQGKEIISNALIGVILVLTSYLLLSIINPRLTKLVLPDVGYYNAIFTPNMYCEAQDLANGNTLATDAAKVQQQKTGKYCDVEGVTGDDIKVTYKDKSGKDAYCFPLTPSQKVLHDMSEIWDHQQACFPQLEVNSTKGTTTEQYKFKLIDVAGTNGICEKNDYTPDDQCDRTQTILSLQHWLVGACKKANVAFTFGITWTGKDVCHYYPFLSCPMDAGFANQVQCSLGGQGTTTPCWDINKPRYKADVGGGNEKAYCVDPNTTPAAIEHVDSVCCAPSLSYNQKIICADSLAYTPSEDASSASGSDASMYVEVSCDGYNASGTDSHFSGWDPDSGRATDAGPAKCSKRCFAPTRLYTTSGG